MPDQSIDRPSMKMDAHINHQMPEPEHDGTELSASPIGMPVLRKSMVADRGKYGGDMQRFGMAASSDIAAGFGR